MQIVRRNNLPISIIHTSDLSIISCNGSSEKIGFYSEELSFIMSNFACTSDAYVHRKGFCYDSSQQKSALISDIDCSELRTLFLGKYLQTKRKIKCLDHFGSKREKFEPKTINF